MFDAQILQLLDERLIKVFNYVNVGLDLERRVRKMVNGDLKERDLP